VPLGRVALWVASLGGFALLARSLLVGPVPWWAAVIALFGYATLVMVGALVPQLEMFADVLWRGLPGSRGAALTFDDGPDPNTTPRVLRALEAANARATFFVIGEKAERHPDLLRDIAGAGHLLAVHGFHHDRLYAFKSPAAIARDIRAACDAVERVTGKRPRWFRPPIGQVSPRVAAGARRAGVEIVGWSVRALDGISTRSAEAAALRIIRRLRPGAIALLHDASEKGGHCPAALDALPSILAAAEERGLALLTIDELVGSVSVAD
jgi:peptidoglycan/xylan/chitin deacetylase (PgdA/CDA1 family)